MLRYSTPLLLATIALAASLLTTATATLSYRVCTDHSNQNSCKNIDLNRSVTQEGPLVFSLGQSPVTGGETVTASAGCGFLNVMAHSGTGILEGPGSGNFPNGVALGVVSGGASFNDVIHFVDGSGTGTLDVTASCNCFRLDTAHGNASFRVGSAFASMGTSLGGTAPRHLLVQFSLNGGTLALSGSVDAGAMDSVPWDSTMGSASGFATAGFSQFLATDTGGNVIHPRYYTDSGTAYLGQEGFVPEPSTWLLIGAGLVVLASRRVAWTLRQVEGRGEVHRIAVAHLAHAACA